MRWLKRLTLLLLLIVVAAGAWISTRDLNLSEWLPEIEAAVRDATGRELKVTGDLEFDLFPSPRFLYRDCRSAMPTGVPGRS